MTYSEDNCDKDWEGSAPRHRGCFRAFIAPPPKFRGSVSSGVQSVSSSRTTSTKGSSLLISSGNYRLKQVKPGDETSREASEKLIASSSSAQRAKSAPPSRQRVKTVVVREQPQDTRKNKSSNNDPSSPSRHSLYDSSSESRALLSVGRSNFLKPSQPKKQQDDWGNNAMYVPPSPTNEVNTHLDVKSPTNFLHNVQRGERSFLLRDRVGKIRSMQSDQTKSTVDVSVSSSNKEGTNNRLLAKDTTLFQSSPSRPSSMLNDHSKNQSDSNKWGFPSRNIKSHNSFASSSTPSSSAARGVQNNNVNHKISNHKNGVETESDFFDSLAGVLSSNLKQMEREIEDLHKKKYEKGLSNDALFRPQLSQEEEYYRAKQLLKEQGDMLPQSSNNIPAEIKVSMNFGGASDSAYMDGYNGRIGDSRKNSSGNQPYYDGDSVSELGAESVTRSDLVSGFSRHNGDSPPRRTRYVNDVDDTVEIAGENRYGFKLYNFSDDQPRSAYDRNRIEFMKNEYRSKSVPRNMNLDIPNVSLIDSDSECSKNILLEEELHNPIQSRGPLLTEAFDDFGIDDRIAASGRKSHLFEHLDSENRETQRRDVVRYNNPRQTSPARHEEHRALHFKDNNSIRNNVQNKTDGNSTTEPSVLSRFQERRSLRSSKYVEESGGGVRLRRISENESDRSARVTDTPKRADDFLQYSRRVDEKISGKRLGHSSNSQRIDSSTRSHISRVQQGQLPPSSSRAGLSQRNTVIKDSDFLSHDAPSDFMDIVDEAIERSRVQNNHRRKSPLRP